ncbi:cyclic pyranopterin monophosphate synthase MoaC [Kordiimonas laminariae]|uniref:cyclic pyranopterin monophosphate synthase MoaC n=1 Tax=Kordiimonas laminariae TaxID=2917717 RepID=UPI001FF1F9B7|nr:cyclic pyranopterin monophosphate synthase MoaC [Kordiimonas laminariae]MCK0071027.1 cyclic pyranopterin monophosphate synthase MoaC [Kordiimonas laminariae]
MSRLTHIDEKGAAHMVDVGEKTVTSRIAIAETFVTMEAETQKLILGGDLPKGDVIAAVRLAGIMAAKKTSDLIPLCHPLPITSVKVEIEPVGDTQIRIESRVKVSGQTGVEMEALTASSVAALTLYDMAKAVDKAMVISGTRLLLKEGGKSGKYEAEV